MMHKEVEVDVDDMIVKSRGRDEHCAALRRFSRTGRFSTSIIH